MYRALSALALVALASTVTASESLPPFEIHRVPQQYPKDALRNKVEGFVDFAATIGQDGAVIDVTILESSPAGAFEAAARESVTKWRFVPKCTARFERPFTIRSRLEFRVTDDPNKADPTLYAVEQHLTVAPPDRKVAETPEGFVIEAVDPCAKQ